jgi:hypothetical protein
MIGADLYGGVSDDAVGFCPHRHQQPVWGEPARHRLMVRRRGI